MAHDQQPGTKVTDTVIRCECIAIKQESLPQSDRKALSLFNHYQLLPRVGLPVLIHERGNEFRDIIMLVPRQV